MRTFPYMDGDRLIELVERRELDKLQAEVRILELALHDAHNRFEVAVKRMEDIPLGQLRYLYYNSRTINGGVEAVRARLIQAVKGEQP